MAPAGPRAPATRRLDGDAEQELLRAVLHAPEALEPAREHVHLHDFRDPGCAALAKTLWEGNEPLPSEGPEAALARELASDPSDNEDLDWVSLAHGAVRVIVKRRLQADLKVRYEQLRRPHSDDEEAALLREITEIGQSLKDWSVAS